MRILIAEDDVALASFVKKGLEAEHYAADVSADGEQSRAMATELDYDLVVLDLNMPRLDGVAVLRYLRTKKPSVPVLVLTGRARVEDRVQCLDLGADDYLVKPFSFTELSARIRALLRRSHLPAESVLAVDDLKLDRVERKVERSGKRIELTSKEYALLEYLMRNAGRRITRAMIIEHVWNLSFDTCTNVVDVYVVDVSAIQSDNGLTLTTSNGTALVAGTRSFDFSTQLDISGVQHIFSQGNDITGKLTGGKLAGLIQVRDQKIPGLISQLDSLASGFATAVNTAHRGGFDLDGTAGGDFFAPPPAGGAGAAAALQVAITDPALIAASSDGSAGSNGNVLALAAVHDQAVAGGQTPADFYSNLVFSVGNDVSNGSAEQDASQLVLRQLQDQRGSVSGVSLDEEATNLIQFQRAFDAAGRMVSTINEMLDVAIHLGQY